MIELMYFPKGASLESAYHLIQPRRGEAWNIVEGKELIGKIENIHGFWNLQCWGMAPPEGLCAGLVKLIESQQFSRLPDEIKEHWPAKVLEVVTIHEAEYLVICKQDTDLERFVKLFAAYIPYLLKEEWPVVFKVYDALMTEDYELTAQIQKSLGCSNPGQA